VTWRRADERPRLRVAPADERAWRLCETVAGLAATNSWTDRTVDPQRRAPAILWEAVGRSLAVERQYLDAERALGHESLHDLGRETLARVERERESLDAIELNLRRVLATAQDIDRQRERRARGGRAGRERERRLAAASGSAVEPTDRINTPMCRREWWRRRRRRGVARGPTRCARPRLIRRWRPRTVEARCG
jgi:hypothetical protein